MKGLEGLLVYLACYIIWSLEIYNIAIVNHLCENSYARYLPLAEQF